VSTGFNFAGLNSMICPNCQASNPEGAKFCMNCGARLKAGQAANPGGIAASSLDRYIPQELLAKLKSARSRGIAGERRVVTVLFCDIKGSTAAAEKLDPEEWTEIVNRAFDHMIRPIYKYEGIVPRLMGDAILAFFGAPIAHEDDPYWQPWIFRLASNRTAGISSRTMASISKCAWESIRDWSL
jgi:class 3 adenylate cyclase